MTTIQERQVLLWVEPGVPPVGRVGTASVAPVAFAGWLELLARLAQLLEVAPNDTSHVQEELTR